MSQGRQGEGPAGHYVDPGLSEEVLEGALIGVFSGQHNAPGGTPKRARASKSSAVPAGLAAPPASGTSPAPVCRASWGTGRWGGGFNRRYASPGARMEVLEGALVGVYRPDL